MFQLQAEGEEESEHTFNKCFAIAKQLYVDRFILKIDGDSMVFVGLADGVSHRSPSGQTVGAADDPTWGNAYTISRGLGKFWDFTTKSGGGGFFQRLNTYDAAHFTFGFFQHAAHTPNDNFILLLR